MTDFYTRNPSGDLSYDSSTNRYVSVSNPTTTYTVSKISKDAFLVKGSIQIQPNINIVIRSIMALNIKIG